MAHDARAPYRKRIQECEHVCGVVGGAEGPIRLVAVAEAAQIGGDHSVPARQPQHDRLPRQPEFRPSVKQQERRTLARFDQMKRGVIRPQNIVPHLWNLFPGQ
jgi:hypothetical protein